MTHAKVAVAALQELNLSFPVFGMVKETGIAPVRW